MSAVFVRLFRWFGRRKSLKDCQVTRYHIENLEAVRQAVQDGQGVLITPNHATHADPYTMTEASYQAGFPFYFMATWHVFDYQGTLGQWFLQKHGVFSIDREATDRRAMEIAQDILKTKPHPLVIFPEGDVYHCNDRVTPFREGAASLALFAARKSKRPIVAIPCGLKYRYLNDPTNELLELMNRLEGAIHWRSRPDLSLSDRLYRLGGALIALKELEYLKQMRHGSLTERTAFLADFILRKHEQIQGFSPVGKSIPERVKELRRRTIQRLEELNDDDTEALEDVHRDLDDLMLVIQLFSYPGNYVIENPSIERIAETMDKLEEDLLQKATATVRGNREVYIRFGDPIHVPTQRRRGAANELTGKLESAVQTIVDQLN